MRLSLSDAPIWSSSKFQEDGGRLVTQVNNEENASVGVISPQPLPPPAILKSALAK